VSELANNGELFDFVSDSDGLSGAKTKYARTLFMQCCEGVRYLHTKNVAHRDLKLENCFLDEECTIKIADLGLMKVFS
jgi:serine/threonine protein kinase